MLAARDVTVRVRGRALLDRVSAAVVPGEVLAVLGENGAGKSTLLKALAGEIPLAAGSVTLDGEPLARIGARERGRRRAVLVQDSSVAFDFTVLDVALLGRLPHHGGWPSRGDRMLTCEALARVDLLHLAERRMSTLSGGERARVHLARVLAQLGGVDAKASRYLLLDEPTASLDLRHQHDLLAFVQRLARTDRIGVLMVLHDIDLAGQYADRMALLRRGAVLAIGGTAEVLTRENVRACFDVNCAEVAPPAAPRRLLVPLPG